MKKSRGKEMSLSISAAMLLVSMILMAVVIPGVYTKTIPDAHNTAAVIGISVAILIRLPLFFWQVSLIKKVRREAKTSKTPYILIGILLLLFGLIYSSGAYAFSNNTNVLYVSYLMFTSVGCDLIAALLTFTAAFFKSQQKGTAA